MPWGSQHQVPQGFPRPREGHAMKLTATAVSGLALPAGKADVIVFDRDMPGFGFRLRRSADGTRVLRSWVVQYKRSGRTARITLGSAQVLGIEAARAEAKKLLGRVALGEDVAANRRDRRDRDQHTLRK